MKNLKITVSAVAVSFMLAACGNQPVAHDSTMATSYNGTSYTNTNNGGNGGMPASCTGGSPNVNPTGYTATMSSQYFACSMGSAMGGVQLTPADGQTKQVCVFPVRMINNQMATFVNNPYGPYSSMFVNQCLTVGAGVTTFNFGTLTFNAVYVVDAVYLNNFAACVRYGDVSGCAAQSGIPFSFGRL